MSELLTPGPQNGPQNGPATGPDTPTPTPPGGSMGKTILIVDDSASVRQVVGIALRDAGYEVLEGVDGIDALGVLDRLQGRKVHLIISDVNMPRMDGIAFVREVKQLPSYRFTPVIMLTTEREEGMRLQGQAAGAKAWVVKPFQPPQMLAAVAKLIMR